MLEEDKLRPFIEALQRKGMTVTVIYTVYDGTQPQIVYHDLGAAIEAATEVRFGRILREVQAKSQEVHLTSRVWVELLR